jgi:hypothetical protein
MKQCHVASMHMAANPEDCKVGLQRAHVQIRVVLSMGYRSGTRLLHETTGGLNAELLSRL